MKLCIATANSRRDKVWKNTEVDWAEFAAKLSQTTRTSESVAEYRTFPKARQDEIKDVGGFVGGKLRDGRRKNGFVECRSMLTLDMDYAQPDIWDQLTLLFDFACCIYSTHKHTPEKPRLRLIVTLSRTVTADEYTAIARRVAADIGIEQFDDTTYEPARLMYWGSTSSDGEFVFQQQDGNFLNPDEVLARYKNWRNTAEWPMSSRQTVIVKKTLAKQADPLTKNGIIGAFCRAYGIQETIAVFLSDVYQPSELADRYDYIPADSSAGVVVYDDKFAYSHHATDPACGKLLNAFDLVRLHKFGELDTKTDDDTAPSKQPSFNAMQDLCIADDGVKLQLATERQAQAHEDFSNWQTKLDIDKNGRVVNTLGNLILILQHDEQLKNIVFNQLADSMEIAGDVPWSHQNKWWRDADDAQLISYIDSVYGTFSARNYDIAVTKVADDRSYHPILEYLRRLPEWDGIPRVDTLLIDYLGASDTAYTRAVTRKVLCAAMARVHTPACKFDTMLVLNGSQGIGKAR